MLNVYMILLLFFLGCTHSRPKLSSVVSESVNIYIYPNKLIHAATQAGTHAEKAIREQFFEIFRHLGRKGHRGQIGIGIVFPYLTWTEGEGKGPYEIPSEIKKAHEAIMRVAASLNVPLLVQFNGAVWHSPSPDSDFQTYWKTVDGGKYLSRYQDGKVNESLPESGKIPFEKLKNYLGTDPYSSDSQNSLFFTLSMHAKEFRRARIETLRNAVKFWRELGQKYPGVITSFTTDSEVSNLSFRDRPNENREISIGFESWNTNTFCRLYSISNCQNFFSRKEFKYSDPLEKKWFEFRAKNHQTFVLDTVLTIREFFPNQSIFTHQMSVLDEENPLSKYRKQDLASPQWTAFVEKSFPGFTIYTHAGDQYGTKRRFVEEVNLKTQSRPWGFLEFNTARAFPGTKQQLAKFTLDFLNHAHEKGVRVIAPLAWESNSLDNGVKGTGVDEGIRQFIHNL